MTHTGTHYQHCTQNGPPNLSVQSGGFWVSLLSSASLPPSASAVVFGLKDGGILLTTIFRGFREVCLHVNRKYTGCSAILLNRAERSTTPPAGKSTDRDSSAVLKLLTLPWYRSVQSLSQCCTLNVGPSFVMKISEMTSDISLLLTMRVWTVNFFTFLEDCA